MGRSKVKYLPKDPKEALKVLEQHLDTYPAGKFERNKIKIHMEKRREAFRKR
jgi:hypothetical protein